MSVIDQLYQRAFNEGYESGVRKIASAGGRAAAIMDSIKGHVSDNSEAYIGGAAGAAVGGAVGAATGSRGKRLGRAIAGALIGGGAGAGVGYGYGRLTEEEAIQGGPYDTFGGMHPQRQRMTGGPSDAMEDADAFQMDEAQKAVNFARNNPRHKARNRAIAAKLERAAAEEAALALTAKQKDQTGMSGAPFSGKTSYSGQFNETEG